MVTKGEGDAGNVKRFDFLVANIREYGCPSRNLPGYGSLLNRANRPNPYANIHILLEILRTV